jgi:hypothetical protein
MSFFFFHDFFDANNYDAFLKYHEPQALTESNKSDVAYRKGVYLTPVTEDLKFHLLRCSSNLQGPTETFSDSDRKIVSRANEVAKRIFKNPAELNHVLAQVYYNYTIDGKTRRAKIPAHSDKTEDMPENGIMAFCTFYDPVALADEKYRMEGEKLMYKNTLALTILRFTKKETKEVKDFILYPGSVLFIDLNVNRDYTHEIVPPLLDAKDVPTRLGYVIRCSKQQARYVDGVTYLTNPEGKEVPLRQATDEDTSNLKKLYMEENLNPVKPEYGFIDFTLNLGDLLAPVAVLPESEASPPS